MTILAHRGLTAVARDNSLDALTGVAVAVENGIDLGIETDVRLVLDGLVMNHDPIESGLLLRNSNFASIADVTDRDQLLSLESALPVLGRIDVVNVEIKQPELVDSVIGLLRTFCESSNAFEKFVISSFVPSVVVRTRRLESRFRTGLLVDGNHPYCGEAEPARIIDGIERSSSLDRHTRWVLELLDETDADYLHAHWSLLNSGLLEEVAQRSKGVSTWTVNDAALLGYLAESPLMTHVVTDFPHLVLSGLSMTGKHRKALPH